MKSAPQMLQLLWEINDLVSFAAGSSCSVSQDLWLDWCQCQSAFTVPALHQRHFPWAAALLSQDHRLWGNLQKGSSPRLASTLWGCLEPLTPKVSSPILWLGALETKDGVMDAMLQIQSLRKSNPQPGHHPSHEPFPNVEPHTGCGSPNSGSQTSSVLGPQGFHCITFLGFCRGYFWQSVKGSLRCCYSLLAMVWSLIYVGKSETNRDLKMLQ